MKLKRLFESPSDVIDRSPCRPYVIAEAGVNHEGNMDIAHRLIAEAAEAGADARTSVLRGTDANEAGIQGAGAHRSASRTRGSPGPQGRG